MSEMPAGTVLGANQSWNAQHDYVQTKSSMCDKQALLAAFTASGVSEVRTWVKDQAAKGVAVPSYPTFVNWVDAAKAGKTGKASAVQSASATATTLTTIEAMEAAIKEQQQKLEQQKADYINLLVTEVSNLRTKLLEAEQKYEKYTGKKFPDSPPSPSSMHYDKIKDAVLEAATKPQTM